MATRSLIGIQLDEKTVKYSYCHWDGYVDNNGRILLESYRDKDKIIDLIQRGSFSSLRPLIDDIEYYEEEVENDYMGNIDVPINEYLSKDNYHGEEYKYLYTLNNEWLVYDVYEKSLNTVDDVLMDIENEQYEGEE